MSGMAGTQGPGGAFVPVPLADRFWFKVDWSKGSEACWLWTGARHTSGYGSTYEGRHRIPAHRAAYTLAIGAIPKGMHVLHSCDVPLCCNPKHLWLGTHLDNMRDREAKGRNVNHRGVAHGMAKLTEDAVRAIRAEYIPAGKPVGSRPWLAEKFGISTSTVDQILSRKTWRHVE